MTALKTSAAYAARLLTPLQIGSVTIPNRLILAPMAGVTDQPFRLLCRRLGAGLAVSEMISANPALGATRKSRERGDHREELGPVAVQIAGADPAQMAEAARRSVNRGAQLIDINLGCPAKKVCKQAAGSALLRDEPLVGRILEAVVNAVEVPVTLKTRTGWSPQTRNLARIAEIALESGISLLTVHGRTRACGYQGKAELDSLASIRDRWPLALVANGDIDGADEALRVLNRTDADAIMIGRAALGRPWIFATMATRLRHLSISQGSPSQQPLASTSAVPIAPGARWIGNILREHLDRLYRFYGERRGVLIARKHIGWYLRDLDHPLPSAEAACARAELMATSAAEQQQRLLHAFFERVADATTDPALAASTTRDGEESQNERCERACGAGIASL